jgi:GMP synthase (glutamine-hydrolysing)
MDQARLKSKIIIDAIIRICSDRGLPATVVRLGDPDAGNIYIKVSNIVYDCLIYAQQRQTDETVKWVKTPTKDILSETQADAYLERQIKYDQDVWIVEIEDPKHRNPFD